MTLYERYLWTRESTARTLVGLFVLASLFIAGYGITHAALSTTYEVNNEVQMNLDVSIIGTQTTGIILSSPQVNGVNHRFATTTGGLLRIRSGSFREDITYTSATIGSDNRVTLVGVTRNICAQYGRQYISCGDGRRWGKGAIVELTYDARLINLKANMDRANTFTSSGAVVFSNSGSLAWPTFATTAARDQQLGANPGGPVRTACVTATGLCYMYIGGAWTAFGNTGVSTATETAVGTVELGTIADQLAKTISGNAGPTVVQTQHLISSGSIHGVNGTLYASRIPILNSSGSLATSLGGTGLTNPSSGSLLRANGSGKMIPIPPGAANNVIVSNGSAWVGSVIPQDVNVLTGTVLDSPTLTNPQAVTRFAQTGSLLQSQLNVKGNMIHVFAAGTIAWAAGNVPIVLQFDSTTVASCNLLPSANGAFAIHFYITTRTTGATGSLQANSQGTQSTGTNGKSCSDSSVTASMNLADDKLVNIAANFGASNASNTIKLEQFIIWSGNP